MRRIKLLKEPRYASLGRDIERIVQAMAKSGFFCSHTEASKLWESYSDSMAAGWLNLPDTDEEIVGCISPYFDPVEPDSNEY